MTQIAESIGIDPSVFENLIFTLGAVALLLLGRALFLRVVKANVENADAEYRARKVVNYTATTVFLIAIAFIWLDAFSNLPTFLGLVSAGVAIALSDVLKNMAGWAFILTRRPFEVGDRIEVTDLRGDVIDVRLFRFSLMEVGGWVDAEQSTGRLVHVPNGLVFNHPVANYTEGFPFIWEEIPVLITFESDYKLAKSVIVDILEAVAPDTHGAAGTRIRETAGKYSIRIGTLTPTVYVSVRDSGVLLTARYLVETRKRRGSEDRVWQAILDAFKEQDSIELAYPTIRTYLADRIQIDRG
ncbi:MAG: mechanosensitive ion channel domain-containing protein [Acidimicrobiia bacterium]